MNWTKEQENLFREALEGNENIMGEAVAGAGKSTAMVKVATDSGLSTVVVAYSRAIANEMAHKLPKQEIVFGGGDTAIIASGTVHQMGKQVLEARFGNVKISGFKFYKIVGDFVGNFLQVKPWSEEGQAIQQSLIQMLSLFRLKMVNPENNEAMLAMCKHHGIGYTDLIQFIPEMYRKGIEVFEKERIIDFDDMIFLPHYLRLLKPKEYGDMEYPKYKRVLVDEAQDLNRLQLKTALNMLDDSSDSKIIFVGDRKQAIFGFQGADTDAIETITARTNAKEMPLSVCFRCPTSHLDLARKYVPQIQPREGAPTGSVHDMDYDHFFRNAERYLKPDDLMICRLNAPLVGAAARLINRGVKARIRGNELGEKLKKIVTKIAKIKGFDFKRFEWYVNEQWAAAERRKLKKAGASKSKIMAVGDYALALISIKNELSYVHNVNLLMQAIDGFFADTKDAIWLSSIHRAKGLEAENVYVLGPELMPLVFDDSQDWEIEQEDNLIMISQTRAKNRLIRITLPKADDSTEDF